MKKNILVKSFRLIISSISFFACLSCSTTANSNINNGNSLSENTNKPLTLELYLMSTSPQGLHFVLTSGNTKLGYDSNDAKFVINYSYEKDNRTYFAYSKFERFASILEAKFNITEKNNTLVECEYTIIIDENNLFKNVSSIKYLIGNDEDKNTPKLINTASKSMVNNAENFALNLGYKTLFNMPL